MILNKELKMKKNILFTCLLLTSLLLTACYNSVFYDVRSDVAPESATVSGNITSITRYTVNGTEFLVLAADGGLRYKAVKNGYHDAWVTMSSDDLPFEPHSYDYFSEVHNGEQILKVLADSNTLYLVTASYVNDSSQGTTIIDKVKLYGTQISSFSLNDDSLEEWASPSWTTIIDEDTSSTYFPTYIYSYYNYSAFAVFQTNAPQASHRKVYIRTGDPDAYDDDYTSVSYYEVSGLSAPTSLTISLVDSEAKESDNAARSAVWFNDSVLFFNTLASTTNETYDTEASRFYYSDGDTLYHSAENSTEIESTVLDAGSTITALMTCSDAIIIGRGDFSSSASTSGGVKKTSLTDGVPGTELIDFTTNASFQLSTSYYVTTLINATPANAELDSDLYAAITYIGTGTSTSVSSKNKGLWSYYPARGNWNRE